MAEEKTLEHDFIIPKQLLNKIFNDGAKTSDLSKKEKEIIKELNESSYMERNERKIQNITPASLNKTRVKENVAKLKDIYLTKRRERRASFSYSAIACR